MREIKFRAWNKKWKHMYRVRAMTFNNNETIHPTEVYAVMTIDQDGKFEDNNYPADIILMQYTGFEDKNSKEIYEGDIIKGFQDKQGIVDFSNGTFWLCFTDKRMKAIADFANVPHIRTALGTIVNGMDGKYLRIIGNIHENPELLGLDK